MVKLPLGLAARQNKHGGTPLHRSSGRIHGGAMKLQHDPESVRTSDASGPFPVQDLSRSRALQ